MSNKDQMKEIMKLIESQNTKKESIKENADSIVGFENSHVDVTTEQDLAECGCATKMVDSHMHEPTCPMHGVVHHDHDMHDVHHDGHEYSHDPDGYEGKMSKSRLFKLANYAAKLHNLLHDDENIEPWVQDKITKAEDYVSSVFHYLEYEKLTEDSKKKS